MADDVKRALMTAKHPLTQDVYHGTQAVFDRFKDNMSDREYVPSLMLGTHVARDPLISSNEYFTDRSGEQGGHVMPLKTYPDEKFYKIHQVGPAGERIEDDEAVERAIKLHAYRKHPDMLAFALMNGHGTTLEDAITGAEKLVAGEPWKTPTGREFKNLNELVHTRFAAEFPSPAARTMAVKSFRDHLIKQGYAGVKYENTAPDETRNAKDKTNYIVFNKPTKEGYYPLRGRFAAFNPEDKASPDLMKSTGGEVKPFPRSKDPKAPINSYLARDVEDVPIEWLAKMHGNGIRLSPDEMADLRRRLVEEGIREPVTIQAGKTSRRAKLGEGNHRVRIAQALGYTHIPARVLTEHHTEGGMDVDADMIPVKGEYFSSEAAPSQVFKSMKRAHGGRAKDARRALMIARDHQALLRRVANIYPGPRGGMDPSPGGGGYAGPGGGKYIGPSNYAKGGEVEANRARFLEGSKAPARLYHGTTAPEDFSVFNIGERHDQENEHIHRVGSGPDPTAYLGSHFAEEPEVANKFAKGLYGERVGATSGNRVYPVHLAIKNPHVTTEKEMHEWMLSQGYGHHDVDYILGLHEDEDGHRYDNDKKFRQKVNSEALGVADEDYSLAREMADKFREHVRAKGHDGIKYKNEIEGGTSWVAFDPRQIKSAIGNRGTYDPNDPDIGKAEGGYIGRADGGKIPPFKLHSGAAKLIAQKGQAKATPQQYAAMPGIKPDEIKYGNLAALGSKSMPREAVTKHLSENMVPLEETQLGGAGRNTQGKFSKYQLPGGENYREVLLHLPDTKTPVVERNRALHAELERLEAKNREMFRAYADAPESEKEKISAAYVASQKRANEIQNEIAKNSSANIPEYKSSHWDEPNVLAHLRMSDRKGPNGEKVLHVEEVQSDWGQAGRDEGFRATPEEEADIKRRYETDPMGAVDEYNRRINDARIPHGPYVDNTQKWTDLALKRVLHEAAHGGYDKVVFTPGDEQADRYDLSKHINRIAYDKENERLLAYDHNFRQVMDEDVPHDVKEFAKHIGKEPAEKLDAAIKAHEYDKEQWTPYKNEETGRWHISDPNGEDMYDYDGEHLVFRREHDAREHIDRILKEDLERTGSGYPEIAGLDLKVGGSGMRGYYDNILPKRLQALAKQHDPQAKVQLGAAPMVEDAAPLHSLDVTPQMRDSIKQNGFNQFKRGGSVEDERVRAALARTVSPFSEDPEHVKEALRIASTFRVPTSTTSPGGYYGVAQDRPPEEVAAEIGGLPGVKPKAVRKMSWEDLHKKGGSFINLGGDRSTFGRLTHINGEPLAWPVDLHAGPNYMRELNPGLVWANAPGHATSLTNVMRRAAEKGPVYGIYAPMGPRAADSAHHMFDAVMAQIPGSDIRKKDAAEFDAQIKQGLHMPPKKRAAAAKALEKWPGVLNAKEASEFARTLTGEQRSGIIQHMDKKSWKDKGFPQIGVTRVAITDPDVFKAPGNMLGHRVVELNPDKLVAESKFRHGTYSAPTAGTYVGDVPLVQRHYAAPDVVEQRLLKPTAAGDIIHPYSAAPVGRSSARKIFEEQKNIQPLNQRQLESVMLGLQRQKEYGLKKGGRAGYADGGGIDQLLQSLKGAFGQLNQQVAAPQQAAAPTYQAPSYNAMMQQALGGKNWADLFPKPAEPAAPPPAAPAAAPTAPEAQPQQSLADWWSRSGMDANVTAPGHKRGGVIGRKTGGTIKSTIVERALAATRRK